MGNMECGLAPTAELCATETQRQKLQSQIDPLFLLLESLAGIPLRDHVKVNNY